jgi:hypothetical protein
MGQSPGKKERRMNFNVDFREALEQAMKDKADRITNVKVEDLWGAAGETGIELTLRVDETDNGPFSRAQVFSGYGFKWVAKVRLEHVSGYWSSAYAVDCDYEDDDEDESPNPYASIGCGRFGPYVIAGAYLDTIEGHKVVDINDLY